MVFTWNWRGDKHENDQKDVARMDGQDYRHPYRLRHDIHRVCRHLMEIVVFLDRYLNNCFIQPLREYL
jgi:hypothetical protein